MPANGPGKPLVPVFDLTTTPSFQASPSSAARPGWAPGALALVSLVGLPSACFMHLQAFYQYGANVLEDGTIAGGYLWGAFGALLPGEVYRKLHIDLGRDGRATRQRRAYCPASRSCSSITFCTSPVVADR